MADSAREFFTGFLSKANCLFDDVDPRARSTFNPAYPFGVRTALGGGRPWPPPGRCHHDIPVIRTPDPLV